MIELLSPFVGRVTRAFLVVGILTAAGASLAACSQVPSSALPETAASPVQAPAVVPVAETRSPTSVPTTPTATVVLATETRPPTAVPATPGPTATSSPGVYCLTEVNVRSGPGTTFIELDTCTVGTSFPAEEIMGIVNTPDQDVTQWLVLSGEPKQYIAIIPGALNIVGINLTALPALEAPEQIAVETPEAATQIESNELAALQEQVSSWLENGLADIDQDSQFYFFGEPLEVGGFGFRPDPLERSNVVGYGKFLGLADINSYVVAYIGFADSTGDPFVVASSLGRTDNSLQLVGVNLADTNQINVADNTTAIRLPTTDAAAQLADYPGQMALVQFFYTQMALSDDRIAPERREEIAYLWRTNEEADVLQRLLYGDLNLEVLATQGEIPTSISTSVESFASQVMDPTIIPNASQITTRR